MLEFGIDISVSKQTGTAKPIPLKEVIRKKPVLVPAWALGSDVYYSPAIPVVEPVEL